VTAENMSGKKSHYRNVRHISTSQTTKGKFREKNITIDLSRGGRISFQEGKRRRTSRLHICAFTTVFSGKGGTPVESRGKKTKTAKKTTPQNKTHPPTPKTTPKKPPHKKKKKNPTNSPPKKKKKKKTKKLNPNQKTAHPNKKKNQPPQSPSHASKPSQSPGDAVAEKPLGSLGPGDRTRKKSDGGNQKDDVEGIEWAKVRKISRFDPLL